MNTRTSAVLCFLLVVPALAPAEDKKPPVAQTDQERLQGKWRPVALEMDGKVERYWFQPPLKVDGDKLFLDARDEEASLNIQLNPTADTKEFDLVAGNQVYLRGIYKLDGDTLIVSYYGKLNTPDRPKHFKTAGGGEPQAVLTLRRVQEK